MHKVVYARVETERHESVRVKAKHTMQKNYYDLNNDPGEKKNVSQQHPEVFERMKAGLQKLLDDGRSRPAKD